MTIIAPFDRRDNPIPRRRNESDFEYAARLAIAENASRRQPISRAELREWQRAQIAEQQARILEIERERVVEVRKRHRQAVGKSPKADKTRRSESWWCKIAYTRGYKTYLLEFLHMRVFGHLSPAEQVLVSFIFMRTVWWLKEWETVRMSQFVSGSRPRDDGTQAFCGTGLSERTVQETLKRLVADGLVLRRDKPFGNGLQEYALPRVDLFRSLPRFAGVNLTFTAPCYMDGENMQKLTV